MADFLIRNIPTKVHTSWKILAILQNISMRDFVILALSNQIEKDTEKEDDRKTNKRND